MPLKIDSVQLDPQTSDPSSPVDGQTWYNEAVQRLRVRLNGSTYTLAADELLGGPEVGAIWFLVQPSPPGGTPPPGSVSIWYDGANAHYAVRFDSGADKLLAYTDDIPAGAGLWSLTGTVVHPTDLGHFVGVGSSSLVGSERMRVAGGLQVDDWIAIGLSPADGRFHVEATSPSRPRFIDSASNDMVVELRPRRTIVVSPLGGDYTTVDAAVAHATGGTASDPWVIVVYPGTYVEHPITVPPHVHIVGVDEDSVILTCGGSNPQFFLMQSNTSIRNVTIQAFDNTQHAIETDPGATGIFVKNVVVHDPAASGVHATGKGSQIIVEDSKVISSGLVTCGIWVDKDAELSASNILVWGAKEGMFFDAAVAWIHNSGVRGCDIGLDFYNNSTLYANVMTVRSCDRAINVDPSCTGAVKGLGYELRDSGSFDIFCGSSDALVQIGATRIDENLLWSVNWDNMEIEFSSTVHDRPREVVYKDLEVGMPAAGRYALFGEGAPYNLRQRVITSDNTATGSTEGGNLTDVSAAASDDDAATIFSFQSGKRNECIYFGADLSDGSDMLKHWGLWLRQTIAAVELVPKSFAFEYWNGSQWNDMRYMAVDANEMYRYGNVGFIRSGGEEFVLYGIDNDTTWVKKSILGINTYWVRIRLLNDLLTSPVFTQSRLLPSFSGFSIDGKQLFSGRARMRRNLGTMGNVFGESGTIVNTNVPVGSGSPPYGWGHRIKNSRLDDAGNAIYFQMRIPHGVDTSQPVWIRFSVLPWDNPGGNADLTASFLPAEVAGVLIADPAGGRIPVSRSASSTATITSRSADAVLTKLDTSTGDTVLQEVAFGPFDISNYYEGDLLYIRLELTDDNGGNIDVVVHTADISFVFWSAGERS